VQQLDAFVLGRARHHRNAEVAARGDKLAEVAVATPLAVTLGVVVRDVLVHGRRGRWYAATCSICLATELLFGADEGAATLGHAEDRLDPGLAYLVLPLRLIRNAVMHPAAWRSEGDSLPFAEQLIAWLEGNSEGALADRLKSDWSNLGHPVVSRHALRALDAAGAIYARKHLAIALP
jgi:hypothetical protein